MSVFIFNDGEVDFSIFFLFGFTLCDLMDNRLSHTFLFPTLKMNRINFRLILIAGKTHIFLLLLLIKLISLNLSI